MNSVTAAEIAQLQNMTVNKLAEKFESLIGEECRSRNKRYLERRLAWRIQADALGGLSERAKKRAAELSLTAEARVTPPGQNAMALRENGCSKPVRDDRLPPAGSLLHREYKGKPILIRE